MADIFKKLIWRHISAVGAPIWTKFVSLVQNCMTITAMWSRSKLEVEFQYDGRLFFKTGSSNISAVNWDIFTKFGVLVDFELLKAVTSTNAKPKMVCFSGGDRHLEISTWRYITAVGGLVWTNSVAWCGITCRSRRSGRDRNRNWYFNMADVCFSETEVIISLSCVVFKISSFIIIITINLDILKYQKYQKITWYLAWKYDIIMIYIVHIYHWYFLANPAKWLCVHIHKIYGRKYTAQWTVTEDR